MPMTPVTCGSNGARLLSHTINGAATSRPFTHTRTMYTNTHDTTTTLYRTQTTIQNGVGR